jgi:tetratricopeptide (TPR) repeat protein
MKRLLLLSSGVILALPLGCGRTEQDPAQSSPEPGVVVPARGDVAAPTSRDNTARVEVADSVELRNVGLSYLKQLGHNPEADALAYFFLRLAGSENDLEAQEALIGFTTPLERADLDKLQQKAHRYLLASETPATGSAPLLSKRSEDVLYNVELALRHLLDLQARIHENPPGTPEAPWTPRALMRQTIAQLEPTEDSAVYLSFRDAQMFVLYRRDIVADGPEVIPASSATLWQLVRPGDQVWLLDKTTSHISVVWSIDREKNTITFVDLWPRACVLREGLNTENVRAQSTAVGGGELLTITKVEFTRVAAGLETMSTPSFPDDLFGVDPAARSDPAVQAAVGMSLLLNIQMGYPPTVTPAQRATEAAAHLQAALDLVGDKPSTIDKGTLLDWKAAALVHIYDGKPVPELGSIRAERGARLFESLDAESLFRVGAQMYVGGSKQEGRRLIKKAAVMDAESPRYHGFCARLALDAGELDECTKEASEAIRLAQTLTPAVLQHRLGVDIPLSRQMVEEATAKAKIEYLRALYWRAKASIRRGNTANAEADGKLAMELKPDGLYGHRIMALVADARGDVESAKRHKVRAQQILKEIQEFRNPGSL